MHSWWLCLWMSPGYLSDCSSSMSSHGSFFSVPSLSVLGFPYQTCSLSTCSLHYDSPSEFSSFGGWWLIPWPWAFCQGSWLPAPLPACLFVLRSFIHWGYVIYSAGAENTELEDLSFPQATFILWSKTSRWLVPPAAKCDGTRKDMERARGAQIMLVTATWRLHVTCIQP